MDGWVDVQRLAIVCVSGRVAGAQIREGGGGGQVTRALEYHIIILCAYFIDFLISSYSHFLLLLLLCVTRVFCLLSIIP